MKNIKDATRSITNLFLCCALAAISAPAVAERLIVATTNASGHSVCRLPYTDPADASQTGVYSGQCTAGAPDGAGSILFDSGDRFEGQFQAGLPHGHGTWFGAAGDNYRGQWRRGERHGRGTYLWAAGSSYVGEWRDNKRHGQGTYTWSNGNRFEGTFADNKHNDGIYYAADGRIHRCNAGDCR